MMYERERSRHSIGPITPGRSLHDCLRCALTAALLLVLASGAVRAAPGILLPASTAPRAARVPHNQIVTLDSAGDVGAFTSLALDRFGIPAVSYIDATNSHLKIARCRTPSCSMVSVTALDTRIGGYTSLALDAFGRPVISAFRGNLDVGVGTLRVDRCADRRCAGNASRATPDAEGFTGLGTSIALDVSGNPVVSYVLVGGSLRLLHCGNPTCTSGNSIATVDSNVYAVQTSLALDATGHPVVSYASFDGAKVVRCDDPACLSGGSFQVLGDTGPFGWQGGTALTLDPPGNPVITFFQWDGATTRLWLAHCLDPVCAFVTLGQVDTDALTGGSSDVTVDANGNPFVSYASPGRDALVVAHCEDAACSTATRVPVDVGGSPGLYSSIVLDAAGRPVVSAYAREPQELRLVYCVTETCE
jgi:hypothetical protein